MKRLIIIIPVYHETPTITECASLQQLDKVYDWRYDVRLVCPEHFTEENIAAYTNLFNTSAYIQHKKYADDFFRSSADYSRLLKTNEFYMDCVNYDYMLIFQTDCWATNINSIDKWLDRDFDYIGSPVFTNKNHWHNCPCCGNGGLSLRKVSSFIRYTIDREMTEHLNENNIYKNYEDVFFCEGVARHLYIDMPIWQECAHFAWDINVELLYNLSNGELPDIGIHAWPKQVPYLYEKLDMSKEVYDAAVKENIEFIKKYYDPVLKGNSFDLNLVKTIKNICEENS